MQFIIEMLDEGHSLLVPFCQQDFLILIRSLAGQKG